MADKQAKPTKHRKQSHRRQKRDAPMRIAVMVKTASPEARAARQK